MHVLSLLASTFKKDFKSPFFGRSIRTARRQLSESQLQSTPAVPQRSPSQANAKKSYKSLRGPSTLGARPVDSCRVAMVTS